jgi:hypothetical protein
MIPRIFEDVARMIRHQRDRLCDVECRAAADADHAIGLVRAERIRTLHHLASNRIAANARKDCMLHTGEPGDEARKHEQSGQPAIGDHERTCATRIDEVARNLARRAVAEQDRGGKGELVDQWTAPTLAAGAATLPPQREQATASSHANESGRECASAFAHARGRALRAWASPRWHGRARDGPSVLI